MILLRIFSPWSLKQQEMDKNKINVNYRTSYKVNTVRSKSNFKTNSKRQIPPALMHWGDNVMHIRIPVGPQWGLNLNWNIKNQSVCVMTLKKTGLYFPPTSATVCLFLIRAVGEFSAQNENSRENSHHHRTAKFSISRNYAWTDVSIWVASMGFCLSFIFFQESVLSFFVG